jgi:hypothetical protein
MVRISITNSLPLIPLTRVSASAARAALNGSLVVGAPITVRFSQPQTVRRPTATFDSSAHTRARTDGDTEVSCSAGFIPKDADHTFTG